MDEKTAYPQHYEHGPFVVPNGNALRDMEKDGNPQRLEAGLLVVPNGHAQAGLEVVPELPQPVNAGRLPTRTGSSRRENDACPINIEPLEHDGDKRESTIAPSATAAASSTREPTIAGMKRRTFWIAMICLAILIAVIIGAAIGGTQASKKSSKEPAAASSPSPSPSKTASSTSTKSKTPTPTPTLQPGFTMQVWSEPGYKGRTQLIYSTGGYKLPFVGRSYSWSPGKFYDHYQCSCATCWNNGDNGWRGFNAKDWPGPAKNESQDFGLVYVNLVCEENYNDPGCPGPADASTYASLPAIEVTSRDPTKTIVYSDGMSTTDAGPTSSAAGSTSAAVSSGTDAPGVRFSGSSATRSGVASPTAT